MRAPRRRPRRLLALATVVLLAGGAACGGGDDDATGTSPAEGTSSTTSTAPPETEPSTDPDDDDGRPDDDADDPTEGDESEGAGTGTTLTGAEICERLPGADLGPVLGLEIVEATAGDDGTPECSYGYESQGGGVSTAAVRAMRPDEDLGGLTGQDAFDGVVELNRTIAEVSGDEEVYIDAGDSAVRLSGEFVHYGVLLLGDQVLTFTIAAGDATGEQVDATVELMASTLA